MVSLKAVNRVNILVLLDSVLAITGCCVLLDEVVDD
jgi:hypothetical protein